MSAYTPPDKIEIYAAALQSDINSERFQQVVNGKLDNLQAQNEALRAELARLKQEK